MTGTINLPASDMFKSVPLAAACNGAVLIGDTTQNQLDSYDTLSGTMTTSWQLTDAPDDIAFDPASNTAYVALTSTPQLAKVDLGATTVGTIPLNAPAVRLALGNAGTIFAMLDGAWNTGPYPKAVAFSPDSTKLLANNDFTLMLFSVATHAPIHSVSVGNCIIEARVAVSHGGSLFYTACPGQLVWFAD
jgi:DNA-binding beta-propeller fold protein YncE